MISVSVQERSTVRISKDQFGELSGSRTFWELVDAGVVSLVRSSRYPHGLRAGAYVGNAVLESGMELRIKEKAAGSVSSLIRWSGPSDRNLFAAFSGTSESQMLTLLVEAFLGEMEAYLAEGRVREYTRSLCLTSRPRGRIDFRHSLRMRARGDYGRVAVRRSDLSDEIEINRLLWLGLWRANRISEAKKDLDLQRRCRSVNTVFEKLHSAGLKGAGTLEVSRLFDQALMDPRVEGHVARALEYARAICLGLDPISDADDHPVGSSYFVRLEFLFERAVRGCMSSVLGRRVSSGAEFKKNAFSQVSGAFEANPDLVVAEDEVFEFIGDCKYKSLGRHPEHSDVYQVLAHSVTFECARSILVYPSDNFRKREYANWNGESSLLVFGVRLPQLEQDLARLCNELAGPESVSQPTV